VELTQVELYLLINTLELSVEEWENFDNDEQMLEGIKTMKGIIQKLKRELYS